MEVLMKNYLIALAIIFLLAGCAKKQAVTEEGDIYSGSSIFEEIESDEIDTSSIFFEETDTDESSASLFEDLGEGEETSVTPVSSTPVTTQGYRVQIGAYQSQMTANSMADRARGSLGRNVYVQYIAPYYKVRVGNFMDKYSATQYKNQLRSTSSYRDAFVVSSEIVSE
jgi:hypothetical protein